MTLPNVTGRRSTPGNCGHYSTPAASAHYGKSRPLLVKTPQTGATGMV